MSVCDLCEKSSCSVSCVECAQQFCAECDVDIHKPAKLAGHKRSSLNAEIPPSTCSNCDDEPSAFFCVECDESFCVGCNGDMHKPAKMQSHTRKPVATSTNNSSQQSAQAQAQAPPPPQSAAAATPRVAPSPTPPTPKLSPVTPLPPTPSLAAAPSSNEPCEVCDDLPAVVECKECNQEMCTQCDIDFHKPAKMQGHVRTPIGQAAPSTAPPAAAAAAASPAPAADGALCDNCDEAAPVIDCSTCDMVLCRPCNQDLHKVGKAAATHVRKPYVPKPTQPAPPTPAPAQQHAPQLTQTPTPIAPPTPVVQAISSPSPTPPTPKLSSTPSPATPLPVSQVAVPPSPLVTSSQPTPPTPLATPPTPSPTPPVVQPFISSTPQPPARATTPSFQPVSITNSVSPLCHLCFEAAPVWICDDCGKQYCEIGGCEMSVHQLAKNRYHIRRKIGSGEVRNGVDVPPHTLSPAATPLPAAPHYTMYAPPPMDLTSPPTPLYTATIKQIEQTPLFAALPSPSASSPTPPFFHHTPSSTEVNSVILSPIRPVPLHADASSNSFISSNQIQPSPHSPFSPQLVSPSTVPLSNQSFQSPMAHHHHLSSNSLTPSPQAHNEFNHHSLPPRSPSPTKIPIRPSPTSITSPSSINHHPYSQLSPSAPLSAHSIPPPLQYMVDDLRQRLIHLESKHEILMQQQASPRVIQAQSPNSADTAAVTTPTQTEQQVYSQSIANQSTSNSTTPNQSTAPSASVSSSPPNNSASDTASAASNHSTPKAVSTASSLSIDTAAILSPSSQTIVTSPLQHSLSPTLQLHEIIASTLDNIIANRVENILASQLKEKEESKKQELKQEELKRQDSKDVSKKSPPDSTRVSSTTSQSSSDRSSAPASHTRSSSFTFSDTHIASNYTAALPVVSPASSNRSSHRRSATVDQQFEQLDSDVERDSQLDKRRGKSRDPDRQRDRDRKREKEERAREKEREQRERQHQRELQRERISSIEREEDGRMPLFEQDRRDAVAREARDRERDVEYEKDSARDRVRSRPRSPTRDRSRPRSPIRIRDYDREKERYSSSFPDRDDSLEYARSIDARPRPPLQRAFSSPQQEHAQSIASALSPSKPPLSPSFIPRPPSSLDESRTRSPRSYDNHDDDEKRRRKHKHDKQKPRHDPPEYEYDEPDMYSHAVNGRDRDRYSPSLSPNDYYYQQSSALERRSSTPPRPPSALDAGNISPSFRAMNHNGELRSPNRPPDRVPSSLDARSPRLDNRPSYDSLSPRISTARSRAERTLAKAQAQMMQAPVRTEDDERSHRASRSNSNSSASPSSSSLVDSSLIDKYLRAMKQQQLSPGTPPRAPPNHPDDRWDEAAADPSFSSVHTIARFRREAALEARRLPPPSLPYSVPSLSFNPHAWGGGAASPVYPAPLPAYYNRAKSYSVTSPPYPHDAALYSHHALPTSPQLQGAHSMPIAVPLPHDYYQHNGIPATHINGAQQY